MHKIYELSDMNPILVFIGGGLGAILRWSLGYVPFIKSNGIFTNTLVANSIAALLIGLSYRIFYQESSNANNGLWLLLATGFCGGLSTFSAFSLESFRMIQNQEWLQCLSYITLNVGLSLLLLIFAYQISEGWKG